MEEKKRRKLIGILVMVLVVLFVACAVILVLWMGKQEKKRENEEKSRQEAVDGQEPGAPADGDDSSGESQASQGQEKPEAPAEGQASQGQEKPEASEESQASQGQEEPEAPAEGQASQRQEEPGALAEGQGNSGETASSSEAPASEEAPVSNGYKIAIDPGHQGKGNSGQEPMGPGSSQMKAKVASGTTGRASGLAEYELNLEVSLKLRDELEGRGYEVYMIRESHDVDISNAERAQLAAQAGADILVRIHANGSEDTSVAGTLTMAPSLGNPYVGNIAGECQRLSQCILDAFCASTGSNSQGVYETDTMSGINWSTIPVTIVEMGYMTNREEDLKMASPEYQALMARGIADGVDDYFGR